MEINPFAMVYFHYVNTLPIICTQRREMAKTMAFPMKYGNERNQILESSEYPGASLFFMGGFCYILQSGQNPWNYIFTENTFLWQNNIQAVDAIEKECYCYLFSFDRT